MDGIEVGTLLRWYGDRHCDDDVDDLGLVVRDAIEQPWRYSIYWSAVDRMTEFYWEDLQEAIDQGQMEIVRLKLGIW